MKNRKNRQGAGAITRRDFLDGVALVAGAVAGASLPGVVAAAAVNLQILVKNL